MRKLAVISYHASPLVEPGAGDAGGMTVYVREVTARLARASVATDIFTRAKGAGVRICHLTEGVRVIQVPAGPSGPLDKHELRRYVDDFVDGVRSFSVGQRLAYELIHSHYWQSGVAGVALAEAWDVPLIHSHHTLAKVKNRALAPGDHPEPPERLAGEAAVIARADVLVASTEDERAQLCCLYSAAPDRITTIHPGVDHSRFHPGDRGEARHVLGFAPDELIVLYAGRIQRLKGVDLAISALEQLAPALDRPVRLHVVGGASGPGGEHELERLGRLAAGLGVGGAVRFLGPRPHHELPLHYRAADVVVVCSHSESFGLAALEAHACGIPVVGTAVGGLSHIVRDGRSGFLVAQRDPAVFAARLKTLLSDDSLRAAFGAEAVRMARRFSWERAAAELLELYDCLLLTRSAEACTC
jgi:D-inositol-3-phosphate glycosyltransferase